MFLLPWWLLYYTSRFYNYALFYFYINILLYVMILLPRKEMHIPHWKNTVQNDKQCCLIFQPSEIVILARIMRQSLCKKPTLHHLWQLWRSIQMEWRINHVTWKITWCNFTMFDEKVMLLKHNLLRHHRHYCWYIWLFKLNLIL